MCRWASGFDERPAPAPNCGCCVGRGRFHGGAHVELTFEIGEVASSSSSADVAAAAMPKRCRSKGVVRAAKRRAFTLRSQNLPEDDAAAAPTTRGDRIAEAMKRGSSDAAAAWPDCDAWRPKSLFEVYYKLQRVVERHDWCAPAPHARRPRP